MRSQVSSPRLLIQRIISKSSRQKSSNNIWVGSMFIKLRSRPQRGEHTRSVARRLSSELISEGACQGILVPRGGHSGDPQTCNIPCPHRTPSLSTTPTSGFPESTILGSLSFTKIVLSLPMGTSGRSLGTAGIKGEFHLKNQTEVSESSIMLGPESPRACRFSMLDTLIFIIIINIVWGVGREDGGKLDFLRYVACRYSICFCVSDDKGSSVLQYVHADRDILVFRSVDWLVALILRSSTEDCKFIVVSQVTLGSATVFNIRSECSIRSSFHEESRNATERNY